MRRPFGKAPGIEVAIRSGEERLMTRAAWGVVLGTIGSAIGFYVWTQRMSAEAAAPRGTVIFKNTPVAS
jgi:hypothetical protein